MESDPGDVTRLLQEVSCGREGAEERLITLVYKELRRLAASYLRKEAPDHSLQPTALVHEAYLRLTRMRNVDWQNHSHFFAVAAKLMRNILVDHARAQLAGKRGMDYKVAGLETAFLAAPDRAPELIALDDALHQLAKIDERQCRVVEMIYFTGLNEEQAGQALGVSSRTVKRDWRAAKAWLFRELSKGEPASKVLRRP
jgi:RNA polymerase sigma factor (TIGR02999 family)